MTWRYMCKMYTRSSTGPASRETAQQLLQERTVLWQYSWTALHLHLHLPQAEHSHKGRSGWRSSASCSSHNTLKSGRWFNRHALMGSQACCSSQGQLQIQDIHELDVEAAAQVVSRKDTGRFAWLQSLALQLYAFCQFCRLHFHHLQKHDTSHLDRTEQQWQPKRGKVGVGAGGGSREHACGLDWLHMRHRHASITKSGCSFSATLRCCHENHSRQLALQLHISRLTTKF